VPLLKKLHEESGIEASWIRGFGDALVSSVRDAAVFVNLRTYGTGCEMKMARFMVLLSQHVCVAATARATSPCPTHVLRHGVWKTGL
jgi:hypothetical protein